MICQLRIAVLNAVQGDMLNAGLLRTALDTLQSALYHTPPRAILPIATGSGEDLRIPSPPSMKDLQLELTTAHQEQET